MTQAFNASLCKLSHSNEHLSYYHTGTFFVRHCVLRQHVQRRVAGKYSTQHPHVRRQRRAGIKKRISRESGVSDLDACA